MNIKNVNDVFYKNKYIVSLFKNIIIMLIIILFSASAIAHGKITVMGRWSKYEEEVFVKIIKPFEDSTGIDIECKNIKEDYSILEPSSELFSSVDIIFLSGLHQMENLAESGQLIDISSFMEDKIETEYNKKWIDMVTYKDGLYGLFMSAEISSIVWYRPDAFKARGYEVPESWTEMEALMKNMISNEDIPWSISLEDSAGTGWPVLDWVQDIIIREEGPEIYDKLLNHDISWTDERVRKSFELFAEIYEDYNYPYDEKPSTYYGDAVIPLLQDPPSAYMHLQAGSGDVLRPGYNVSSEEAAKLDVFPFPPINGKFGTPILGNADLVGMLNDTPDIRAFMLYLSRPEIQEVWVKETGKLAVNNRIDLDIYDNQYKRKMAEILNDASTFRYGIIESRPIHIRYIMFSNLVYFDIGEYDLNLILKDLEDCADKIY